MTETDNKNIRDFLRDNYNAGKITKEEWDAARKDSYDMDLREFTDKYDQLFQEKTVGWSKLRKPKEKELTERIREDFGDMKFNPSENWKKEIYYEKYKDIPKEQFEETLSKMKNYYDDEIKQREYEAGKARRKKEIEKDWGWRNLLASDYEKQRYINEPEKALFGKDAGNFSDNYLAKGEALSDLLYGGAGVVGDMIPGAGTVLGPVARGLRDVQHKGALLADKSKYQKEGTDILGDFGADLAFSYGTEYLPTAIIGKTKRGAKNLGKTSGFLTDVGEKMSFNARKEANDLIEKNFDKIVDSADDVRQFDLLLEKLPESDIKKDLIALRSKPDFDKSKVNDYIYQYKDAKKAVNDKKEMFGYKVDKKTGSIVPITKSEGYLGDNAYDFFRTQERNKAMTKKALKSGLAAVGGKAGLVGGAAVKVGETGTGRKASKPSESTSKEWYKQNYSRDWLLGFKPKEKEGDPLWEAYEEWEAEQKGE